MTFDDARFLGNGTLSTRNMNSRIYLSGNEIRAAIFSVGWFVFTGVTGHCAPENTRLDIFPTIMNKADIE